jgi:two-component system, cell cycle sensor histidine kinase and response regulator CckA
MSLPSLRSLFERLAPPLEPKDPAERLSARLVSAIVDLLLVAGLAFFAVTLVGPTSAPALYRFTFPVSFLLLYALRRLVRSGHVRPAATLLCVCGWLIIATDLKIHGPHTVATGGFLLMVVIGGLTLGPLAALSLATATIVLLATVMFRLDHSSLFVEPSPWTRWFHYSTQLMLGSVLVAWWAHGMKRLVGQLRESEARHAQLLEDSPDATVCVDRDGIIIFWNTAAEQMLGYPRSVFVGRRWDTVPTLPKKAEHVDRARTSLSQAMIGASAPVHEFELVHRDGHTVIVEVKSVPLRHHKQIAGVISTVRDITARKRADRERAVLEEQLVSVQRMEAVGRFAGGIAHDFNNILTIIFNATEVIRLTARDDGQGAVADVLEAATRGASLARQLLAFSRHQPSEPRPTDVNATIVALRPMLARLVGEDVSIELDLRERLPPTVLIGPGQLDQVLLNRTINARDAMPSGGTIHLTAAISGEASDSPMLEFVFADTGCGMDASTTAQAFEPFFSTKGERGSGLGLSIVKRIVHQAGGTIRCESELGRGTTFRIVLPLVPIAPSAEPPKVPETGKRAKRRIVLVDDDPLVRLAVARALQSVGLAVDSIATPLVVADVEARLRQACALITDVVMPGMTGPDLVDELRRRGCRTPVIFVSGYADHALLARIRSASGATLLPKPFTAEDILAKLNELAPTEGASREAISP